MCKYSALSNDLIAQLSDQFKIEYNKITGRFAQGDLSVIETDDYFYFRATDDAERLPVVGGVLSGNMSGDDADFLASMLSFAALTWSLDLQSIYSSMTGDIRKSRPDIVSFFKS